MSSKKPLTPLEALEQVIQAQKAPKFGPGYQETIETLKNLIGGSAPVIPSPDNPHRHYSHLATKGDAGLYANVSIEPASTPSGPVLGVVVRFFQMGGESETFSPPLSVRANYPEDNLTRLSKHDFPFQKLGYGSKQVPIRGPWVRQEVGPQLMDWLHSVITMSNATPTGTKETAGQILNGVVNLALHAVNPSIENGEPGSSENDIFSVEESLAPTTPVAPTVKKATGLN